MELKKEGFLFLKSSSGVWKKNWVVLHSTAIILYQGPEKGEVEKNICLTEKTFEFKSNTAIASYRKFCFEISSPERVIFSAASELEKTQWIEHLEVIKSGTSDLPPSPTSFSELPQTNSPRLGNNNALIRKNSSLPTESKFPRPKSFLPEARELVEKNQKENRASGFFVQVDEDKQVKSGSVEQLIDCLYTGDHGNHYADIFLISYRSFTTKRTLLSTLYIKYLDLGLEGTDSEYAKAGRLKIINFLKHWINFNQDFFDDEELIDSFFDFCDEIAKSHAALSQQLEKNVKMKLEGEKKKGNQGFGHNPPESILPTASNWNQNLSSTFIDLNETEIARQICLLQQGLFRKIETWEFFGAAWTKLDKAQKCPNLVKMTENFNELSRFVELQILTTQLPKERIKLLRKWIVIANELRKLGNFNAVFAIISGFSSAAVFRLKKTFAGQTKDKTKLYEELTKMTQPHKSWANYREVLKVTNPPSIPYIGVYQTDLVFLEDGSPTYCKNGDVNFQKSRLMAGIIKEIRQFQNLPYNLSPVQSIQDYLKEEFQKAIAKSDEDLWKLSKEIEP